MYHCRGVPGVPCVQLFFATSCSFRCNCHGHADNCDTAMEPYRCLCIKESYTEGNNVSRILCLLHLCTVKSSILELEMRTYVCYCFPNFHRKSCYSRLYIKFRKYVHTKKSQITILVLIPLSWFLR